MQGLRVCALLGITLPLTAASWNVARSEHFEIWSDAPAATTRALGEGLERLHTFFVRQLGIGPRGIVKVVNFSTTQEYNDYRIRAGAAGFSLLGTGGEYIVINSND